VNWRIWGRVMPEKRQAGDRQGGEYGLGSVRQRLEISRFLINETVGFTEPGRLNSSEIMLFGADIFLYDHINSTLLRTLGSKPYIGLTVLLPRAFRPTAHHKSSVFSPLHPTTTTSTPQTFTILSHKQKNKHPKYPPQPWFSHLHPLRQLVCPRLCQLNFPR
jgi:hypothetical protein